VEERSKGDQFGQETDNQHEIIETKNEDEKLRKDHGLRERRRRLSKQINHNKDVDCGDHSIQNDNHTDHDDNDEENLLETEDYQPWERILSHLLNDRRIRNHLTEDSS